MHAAVQSEGHSPKSSNGQATGQSLKPDSDSIQSSSASFPSLGKGKKRERIEAALEPVKRERSIKSDGDSNNTRNECVIKAEIAKITEKGELITFEAVEKLVQMIYLDKTEKRLDFLGRMRVADVIAATERLECLHKFVQLKGVTILDDWLQEIQKVKISDGSNSKEGDKPAEGLLLALLRALDKLPVDLNALKTCNIGKSVNHLRSNKNPEIQKKARNLVDAWKKRVDLEMKINDAKPGAFEASQVTNKRTGSSDISTRCSTVSQLPSLKSTQTPKTMSAKMTSSPTSGALMSKCITTDLPLIEKTSVSWQTPNNNNQSSSDVANPISSGWKEDAKVPALGSLGSNKTSSSSSRHKKTSNGFLISGVSVHQKENPSGKNNSLSRTHVSDKVRHYGCVSEKSATEPTQDQGNSHRLIVRLPNPSRSPVRSTSGDSLEDHSFTSNTNSPQISEKIDHHGKKLRGSNYRANAASNMNAHDIEEVPSVSSESTETGCNEVEKKDDPIGKSKKSQKSTFLPSLNDRSPFEKSSRPAFSSIDALIESCVKGSESDESLSAGDDLGMNLLASVAAGEISGSSTNSPEGTSPTCDGASRSDATFKSPCDIHHDKYLDSEKDDNPASLKVNDEINSQHVVGSVDREDVINLTIHKSASKTDHGNQVPACGCEEICSRNDGSSVGIASISCGQKTTETKEDFSEDIKTLQEREEAVDGVEKSENTASDSDSEQKKMKNLICKNVIVDATKGDSDSEYSKQSVKEVEMSPSCSESLKEKGFNAHEGWKRKVPTDSKPSLVENHDKVIDDSENKSMFPICHRIEQMDVTPTHDDELTGATSLSCTISKASSQGAKMSEHHLGDSVPLVEENFRNLMHEIVQTSESQISNPIVNVVDESHSATELISITSKLNTKLNTVEKIDFDLNEGFLGEEPGPIEPLAPNMPNTNTHLPSLLPFTVSSVSSTKTPPVTVAAALKGPFVLPESPVRSTEKLGWKGSAATSAFRPAEPRKLLEMPLSNINILNGTVTDKPGRPFLDIDLNVPDERIVEDTVCPSSCGDNDRKLVQSKNSDFFCSSSQNGGTFDLDLNRTDEGTENGHFIMNLAHKTEPSSIHIKSSSSGGLSNAEENVLKGFDLNNGPDEVGIETRGNGHHGKSTPPLPATGNFRVNSTEHGSSSSPWFLPSNSYPGIIPSFLSDRGEETPFSIISSAGPQRIMATTTGGKFNGETYRGPTLSSSAMSFPPPFAYPGFPFGSTFQIPSIFSGGSAAYMDSSVGSSYFPSIPPQIVGSGSVSTPSHYPRPYLISVPSASSGIAETIQKWGRQGLDLNAGPGGMQDPQILGQEQARIHPLSAETFKKKDQGGGWDTERFNYKQSWP